MDVNATTRSLSLNVAASYAKTQTRSKDKAAGKETAKTNEAFELSLSSKESAGSTTVDKIANGENTKYNHTDAIKGLNADQVQVLKDGITKSTELMIKTLTEQNMKLQGWLDEGIGKLNFDGVLVDAYKFSLPPVATTPEEAQAAISEGGDWSVDAVATRIFDLASTIAGGDPEKLQKMQDAVKKGFEQAGLKWKEMTDQDDMPEITHNTYNEIMSRFDKLMASLKGTGSDAAAGAAVAASVNAKAEA